MPGRRPLLTLVALFAIPLPACLHVSAPATPITPPDQAAKITAKAAAAATEPPKGQFGILPKLPGTAVPTKPGAPATPNPNTTAQKPTDVPPANTVRTLGGNEPGAFPLIPQPGALPPEPLLLAAVRAYVENRPDDAIKIIRRMDKDNQDLVLAVLPVLARGATADLTNDPATTAALVEQLRGIMMRLEPRAALKVEKVAFCTKVAGFGQFVQRPEANPYRPNERVHLYLELRNLGNQLTGDGFLTHVHAAVEIRDANDKVVAQIDPDDQRRVPVVKFDKRLVTRSPLSDFYVLYGFAAPTAPGVYTVTVQLTDPAGRRTTTSRPAEFRVAGP